MNVRCIDGKIRLFHKGLRTLLVSSRLDEANSRGLEREDWMEKGWLVEIPLERIDQLALLDILIASVIAKIGSKLFGDLRRRKFTSHISKIWVHNLVRLNRLEIDMPNSSDHPEKLVENDPSKGFSFLKIDQIYWDKFCSKLVISGRTFDLVRVLESKEGLKGKIGAENELKANEEAGRATCAMRHRPDTPLGYKYYSPTPVNESNLVVDIGGRLAPIITSDLAKFTEPNLITHNNITKWKPCRAAIIIKAEELAEKEMILAFDKFSNGRGSRIKEEVV
ncbi:hypothetical protein BY996DRAFT_6483488 [Phakopsora pachyrhizi]|nr:hypothetical protein BY996DRAFT_6483488 [Phakopsora pachyrhizi]